MFQDTQDNGTASVKSTEQAIMDAAEEVFLEKGYNLATTTLIAKKAGVTHAMLHYYFRTKEHIFMKVLEKILRELMQSFRPVMSKGEPFWETLEKGISTHFDFFVGHPRFATFLYDTIMHNPELVVRLKENVFPLLQKIYDFHIGMIREEMDSGRINEVDPMQLIADIVTLNLSTYLLLPVAGRMFQNAGDPAPVPDEITLKGILENRKAEIIALIRYRLYGKIQ